MLHRSETLAARDVTFGEGIKNKYSGRATFRLRINIQFGDEFGIETGGAAPLDVERESFGALGRERKFQLPAEGVPIALTEIFPATKPFQTVKIGRASCRERV